MLNDLITFQPESFTKFRLSVRERPTSELEYYYASCEQALKDYLTNAFDEVYEATIEEYNEQHLRN